MVTADADFKSILAEAQHKQMDPMKQWYCWRHSFSLENPLKPTQIDEKKLEKIKLKPIKTVDKFGKVTFGRYCSACGNTLILPDPSSILIPEDKNKNE